MASLFVIQGADQGRRFELRPMPMAVGRDGSNLIRLHDHEVSRRHAELRPEPPDDGTGGFRLVDLRSANGTYVNGQMVDQVVLRSGDRLRVGQTVMLFHQGEASSKDLTERVDLLGKASPRDRSAIIRSIPADEGSFLLDAPESTGDWLKARLSSLSALYQATRTISLVTDLDELLPQILQLAFESVGADRGAILLLDEMGQLQPKAVRWKDDAEPDERLSISRTIIDHVLEKGEGVITTDAPSDRRFGPTESIIDYAIREAICVPVQGRHSNLGVLYADTLAGGALSQGPSDPIHPKGRLGREHLTLMVAIGHQAGLAIENTRFHDAKVQAERLAAVGQTIATLSHHIKNILQGLRGGSYLIDMGLKEKDDSVVRRGWSILEKNQAKIYNMVMDMLSFSKEREPALETASLNETVGEVVELMQSRAGELGVALDWRPGELPDILFDPDGLHRAVLNIVTNAIDACEDVQNARVSVSTSWDGPSQTATVSVEDNGVGISEEDLDSIFQVFASSKGTRGTGLGLPVSQKILREHGGDIKVQSQVGRGTRFALQLPQKRADARGSGDDLATMS